MTATKWSELDKSLRRKHVGELIRKARLDAELTQGELARRLRYRSPQFVSNWERGESFPPMQILARLVKVLDVSPRTIIDALTEYQMEYAKRQREVLLAEFATA